MRAVVLLVFVLLSSLVPSPARAHARSVSYSTWWLSAEGATVRARITRLDANLLERAGVSEARLPEHASRVLGLRSDGAACSVVEGTLRAVDTDPSFVEIEWQLSCSSLEGLTISSDLLVDQNPTHLHFARVATGATDEAVLDARQRAFAVSVSRTAPAKTAGLGRFVLLGIEHIASGWDHLLFVLVLVMAGASFRRTALVVTGFTVGHSVTLALATLGGVVPEARVIEALIGLSIVLLALENVWLERGRQSAALPTIAVLSIGVAALAANHWRAPGALAFAGVALFAGCYFGWVKRASRPEVLRASVAALFGLVHGFGFARVLRDLELSGADLARGLMGFNLGVELGQLAFVALLFPLIAWARRREALRPRLVELSAAFGIALGCYWFVLRAFA